MAFTKVPERGVSLGMGDRTGMATAGHLAVAREYDFFPVFAQQSVREMTFTHRSYADIKNDVLRAVDAQSGQKGAGAVSAFGFDGDHLKTMPEIEAALGAGITMLTLDCSLVMNAVSPFSDELRSMFSGKNFDAGGLRLTYSKEDTDRLAGIYGGVVGHILDVWARFPQLHNDVAFEVSIDETTIPTDAHTHFMLAYFLRERGVRFATLAPRFPGEFQKGIDYIGDIRELEQSLKDHKAIADHFGYRLSIHSGSDKFSAFPLIGNILKEYHLKTAGTSYLEFFHIIGKVKPEFFWNVWQYSIANREEMGKFYHLGSSADNVPSGLTPEQMLDHPDARQILHCSYMFTLNPENELHEPFMALLKAHEDEYHNQVERHFIRHVESLGIPKL